MDIWKEMLGTYGSELQHCPRLLKSQLLSIIPKELKTEVLREKSLTGAGYEVIIDWIKNRATILQQENLAIVTKHNLNAHIKGRVNSIEFGDASQYEIPSEYNDAPPWARHLIAAVKSSPVPAPPEQQIDAVRPSRGDKGQRGRDPARRRDGPPKREGSGGSRRASPSGGKQQDGRRRSPSVGRRGVQLIGWDNRCYHCGSREHRRPENDEGGESR